MKKDIIIPIITFILGGIIFETIGVTATTLFVGSEISYDKSKTNLTSDNVQDAIDEMYDKTTFEDANSENIMEGKTTLINGNKIIGTMTNNGSTGGTINPGGSYTIPAGYTSGETVTANPNQNSSTYTYANGSTGETVDMGVNNTYRYVNAGNVYSKGVIDGKNAKEKFYIKYETDGYVYNIKIVNTAGTCVAGVFGEHVWDYYESELKEVELTS